MSSEPPLLELENVEVHFEDKPGLLDFGGETETVRAVDGVSLTLDERDVLSLVGESGCGKTTLGKTAIGLQRPTGGSVKFRGHDIWEVRDGKSDADITWKDIRTSLQIIHQDPGASLNPNRRILSILSEPLNQVNAELSRSEKRERIYALLERVGMNPAADFAERYPHQLSGGEKQRVALSRALLMNPDVILADEAISALDVSLRVEMMDLILDLQETFDTSYVFISHDLANARYLAKRAGGRIAIMYLGNIVEIGGPDEVIQNPSHPYTEVLRWSTPSMDPDVAMERIKEKPPVRQIDVPDPQDPPSGCAFHPRCTKAREACAAEDPELYDAEDTEAACFRALDNHEYWSSPELEDAEGSGTAELGVGD